MRLPLLAVILLVVAAVPAGVAGAPASHGPAATTDATAQTTLSGTVTYLNGTAAEGVTVLVGNGSLLTNASTEQLRELAADPPADAATATTDAEGRYTLTATDSVDAEAVVAVSAAGTSRIRRYSGGELNLTLRTTEPLAFESEPVTNEPGGRATVTFTLEHSGDQAVEGLSLALGALPDGWNVARTTAEGGSYTESNRTFTWSRVEPGETITAELTLFVALGALDDSDGPETFTFPMFAGSNTHPVSTDDTVITVRYPTERTETDAPGFGVVAGVLAVLATVLLARRQG